MLGDQIGEETGKVLVIRVVDSAPLKAEVSIHTKGKLFGNDYEGRATYPSTMQAGGFLYGEGHGAYLTAGGDVATAGIAIGVDPLGGSGLPYWQPIADRYQLNLTIPSGLGTGDVSLQGVVGGAQTPSGVVITLQ